MIVVSAAILLSCGGQQSEEIPAVAVPLPAPAAPQPIAEAQVAQDFKHAAPDLFQKWVEARSNSHKNQGILGKWNAASYDCGP